MQIAGIDLSALPSQFEGFTPGRTLIIDGDGPAYVAAATVKTLPTGVRRFQQAILTAMFLAKAEHAIVHLTASGSTKGGRFLVDAAKPYQGNRTSKSKPALLEALRHEVAKPEHAVENIQVELHFELEADDAMMIDAYRLGTDGIIRSEDKDLRMTPYPYWCISTARMLECVGCGDFSVQYTESGNPKPYGHGRKFFWGQMMMGDTADNIQGLKKYKGKLCGVTGAADALAALTDENEVANHVIDAYREINQNPVPEGWLLWLLRQRDDTVWKYFQELQWSPQNQDFLIDCVNRPWFRKPVEREEFDDIPY